MVIYHNDPPDPEARILRKAQQQLPAPHSALPQTDDEPDAPDGPLQGTVEEFEEFMWHSEYELAWDALVALADRVNAGDACWRTLAEAKEYMELTDEDVVGMETFRRHSNS